MNISVILPVRNESTYIERGLQAIVEQDYPLGSVEILIADGMSTDDTRPIILQFSSDHPQLKILLLDNPGKIVPTGMNIALRHAKGEVVIRVDGHCLIAPDYVRRCVEHIRIDGVDGVGGPMETIGETSLARTIAVGMSSPFGVGNSAFRTMSGKSILADTVPFPAYTRQIIERAGFYDEELVRNQDDEYNYRIRELGGRILLAEDVHSSYFSRSSLKGLWRQYYQYGYWKVRVLQKHPRQMSLRQFVPPVFVFALLGSGLAALFSQLRPLAWIVPSFYLVVNILVSIWTASKRGWQHVFYLPMIFMILHLSYGSGFLVGLVKFWNRWNDKIGKVPAWSNEPG
ncbi:MAG: glycosyltransferase family 2 protein [Chloroflexi bacterium]|nr:glycosyltransferase family 2 protein [Chloroflexota bacterium]